MYIQKMTEYYTGVLH